MKTRLLLLLAGNIFLAANSQTITVPGTNFGTLVPLTVSYLDAGGIAGSWIGLYRANATDGDYMTYIYINESVSGSVEFPGREETGLFNFRLFRGGGYDKIGTSSTFMIRQGMLPDASFDEDGIFRKDFLSNSLNDWAVAVRVTRDDKIVVAGTAKTGLASAGGYEQNEFVAARFLANGQPDPTFGNGGFARTSFPGIWSGGLYINATEARAMVVQDDEKVVVGGIAMVTGDQFGVQAVVLVRFDRNGLVDNTYGDRGVMVDNFKWPLESAWFAFDDLRCMELDAQGRILIGGGSLLDLPYSPGRPWVGRYTTAGLPDQTFGVLGQITPTDSIAFRGYVESISPPVAGGDGSMFAGITQVSQFAGNYMIVLKLHDNGTFATDFGHQGMVVEHRPNVVNDQRMTSLGLTPGGNLVMMGSNASWSMWMSSRNPTDGSRVNAFGDQGVTVYDATYSIDVPCGMIFTPDNGIVIGTSTMGYRWSVARFQANGSIRADFGVPFYMITENGYNVESFVRGIAMQSDGKYVLVGGSRYPGASNWDFMTLRFIDNPEMLSGIRNDQQVKSGLEQNFPNPFNETTTIGWTQVSDSHVILVIYDILGSRVAEPVNEIRPAGRHQLILTPGRNGSCTLAPGTYYYRITVQPIGSGSAAYTDARRMIVLPESR